MSVISHHLRGGLGLAAGVASLAVGATALLPTAGSAAVRPAATVPECGVGQLSARLIPGSPGAGQRYATLALKNISHRSCRTGGYVGLGLATAGGRPVVTHVVRTERSEVRTVILNAGEAAASQLHWAAVEGTGDRPGGPCFRAPARVLITPPNAYRSLELPWRGGPVCEAGQIGVTPLLLAN